MNAVVLPLIACEQNLTSFSITESPRHWICLFLPIQCPHSPETYVLAAEYSAFPFYAFPSFYVTPYGPPLLAQSCQAFITLLNTSNHPLKSDLGVTSFLRLFGSLLSPSLLCSPTNVLHISLFTPPHTPFLHETMDECPVRVSRCAGH